MYLKLAEKDHICLYFMPLNATYKALHFPEQMTREDAEGVAECLRVRHHFCLT